MHCFWRTGLNQGVPIQVAVGNESLRGRSGMQERGVALTLAPSRAASLLPY